MNDASRDAFEAWFESTNALDKSPDGNYKYAKPNQAWNDWQASRKQALEEYEAKLQAELDHAAINDHSMTPPFGRVQGEPGVRAGSIEAVIEFMNGKV